MSRLNFFPIRLAISTALLLLAYSVIRLLWYPGAYFAISGVAGQVWMLVAVVLVVGPILSTLVFRPGKKGLKMDLWILGAIEVLAVAAALLIIYQRQPYFAVFAIDRFEAVSLPEVVDSDLARKEFGSRPGHEPRLIFASLPEDPERMQALIDETVLMGMPDIDRRPEFWAAYPAGVALVREAARPLEELIAAATEDAYEVSVWLESEDRSIHDYLFVPLRGRKGDAALIIDTMTGYPVASLAIDPWVSSTQDGEPPGDIEQTHE
jgi:hypothetical protein